MRTEGGFRGLLLPFLLIVAGLVLLLTNVGLLPSDTLFRLIDLWPLVLVVLGVELILQGVQAGRTAHAAGVALLGVAVVASVLFVALGPAPAAGNRTLDRSEPLGEVSRPSLRLGVGAAEIHVHGEALGFNLYKVHILYSGREPRVAFDPSSGTLRIDDAGNGFGFFGSNHRLVDVTLNDTLPWTIDVGGGATNSTFDLTAVKLAGLNIRGGANRLTATLPQPSGTVTVEISGGASTVTLNRPRGVPVSVTGSGGANSIEVDGQHYGGIGDIRHESAGYSSAGDRYAINLSGGASSMKIGTT